VFADKSYTDEAFFNNKEVVTQNHQVHTPVKLVKGETGGIRQREKTANNLYSYAVSTEISVF
jgi:hypothetical protein